MQGFHSKYIQVDEIWTFVKKKQHRLTPKERLNYSMGDQYIFVALDAESKLVPSFAVGKRDSITTLNFLNDLSKKLNGNGRIQITSDGFHPYTNNVEYVFGTSVDYAQQVKTYEKEHAGRGRYAPPRVSEVLSTVINGNPEPDKISTSYVERQNLTMRMHIRRLTRLTNAFSKKLRNLKAAVALHFAHYNFCRIHQTLRVTPAMEAEITDHVWSMGELLTRTA